MAPEIDLTNLKRICLDLKGISVPLKKKLQFFHPLFEKMSREDANEKFFTYDVVIDDFQEEHALAILKAFQENAPDSSVLKEKLFKNELPFTGRQNITLDESNKLRNNLVVIPSTQVTIKRSD